MSRFRWMKNVVTALIAVCFTASLALAAAPVNVSAQQAKELLAKKKNLVLLDVRTPEEYNQAHLKGATLIPLSELQRRVKEVPRNKPLLVYCAVGARSLNAARFLTSKGYPEVYQIADGLIGWYKSGFPLERGGR